VINHRQSMFQVDLPIIMSPSQDKWKKIRNYVYIVT